MAPAVVVEYAQQKEARNHLQGYLVPMMSKTQRSSKGGYPATFVPDYRHAVENMGESEGFGSSGRFDTEMTASEDSCAPKRKCINLNVDSCDSFSVPIQVLSVSKMSRSDKKELEMKLRMELEQIKLLQKKIVARFMNGVAFSSSNDIRSCDDGRKKPAAESIQRSSDISTGQGKKRPAPSKNEGPWPKRGVSGRFESLNQAVTAPLPSTNMSAMLMKQCEALLKKMMTHTFGWVFNKPVDVVELNIPDYFNVIKHPMDLGTIKINLDSGAYSSPLAFLADVRLTFSNAMTYNPPENDVHVMANTLSKFFEQRWKAIEKKLPPSEAQLASAKPGPPQEVETSKPLARPKKKKPSSANQKVKTGSIKRIMTAEEKQNLSKDLESFQGDIPEHIIDFLRNHSFSANQTNEDEIEIDIDDLSDETLLTLRKLVDDYLHEKQADQVKEAEPCDMEVLNESGLSNSSMQPCKANEPADEDVDIGGNDLPVSSYPPVEIEKDTVVRKCSSSSSSSSDSGSSSSDSDSASSSGSESDGAKASSPAHAIKDTAASGAALDQEISGLVDPHSVTRSVAGTDQTEQSSHCKPGQLEAESRQEGENNPSLRPVSPDRLYRAAVLRNRFADTILRAKEKALDQGEKGDPDKIRREREELERLQREEKARLQAEAKAAEDARKQAEAEAAAEAKRLREIEREAARQALQKMEKTVEINENCQFLKDLEMLGTAIPEHLPSSVDETSPEHSQDGLGAFKLRGNNPLEQLGLYMKVDDEDEDEGGPQSEPLKDVEEGEID